MNAAAVFRPPLSFIGRLCQNDVDFENICTGVLTLFGFIDSLYFRAVLAALVIFSLSIYSQINRRDPGRYSVLTTRLDERIPFVPAFSVPYLIYIPYLFFIVGYGILFSRYYAQIAASTLAVQLAAAAVYHIHQTHVPRPQVNGRDPFSRLTAFIYSFDRPYCAYPSLHVAYSLLCCYWASLLFPALTAAFVVLTVFIIASTLFLKQHVIADVVSGLLLTVMSLSIIA